MYHKDSLRKTAPANFQKKKKKDGKSRKLNRLSMEKLKKSKIIKKSIQ